MNSPAPQKLQGPLSFQACMRPKRTVRAPLTVSNPSAPMAGLLSRQDATPVKLAFQRSSRSR